MKDILMFVMHSQRCDLGRFMMKRPCYHVVIIFCSQLKIQV